MSDKELKEIIAENAKNTNAIDKIIAELAMKDFLRANPRKADGKPKYKKYHPYRLSEETNEARDVKFNYLDGLITEEQYKGFCISYNLRTRQTEILDK